MSHSEQILYDIQLPEFVNKFKLACVEQLVPPIDMAIETINSTSSPLLFILLIILFVQLLRVAIVQAQSKSKGTSASQGAQFYMMAKEIRDLKRQVKGIQKTMKQIKEEGLGGLQKQVQGSQISNSSAQSLIQYCRDSWSKRQEIADHILDYQTKLMKEIKKLKGKNKSSSPSKVKASNVVKSSSKPKAKPTLEQIATEKQPECIPVPVVEVNDPQIELQQSVKKQHKVLRTMESEASQIDPSPKAATIKKFAPPTMNSEGKSFPREIVSQPKQNNDEDFVQNEEVPIQVIETPIEMEQNSPVKEEPLQMENVEVKQQQIQEEQIQKEPLELQNNQNPIPPPVSKGLPPRPTRPGAPGGKRGGKVPPPPRKV